MNSPHDSSGADGRFAPSPTGPLLLCNLRTALLAWLFARSQDARFLVRVEDLDCSRVRPGMEEAQLADLCVLGLDWQRLAKRRGALTVADRRVLGEGPEEVLAWMASSLGLAEIW